MQPGCGKNVASKELKDGVAESIFSNFALGEIARTASTSFVPIWVFGDLPQNQPRRLMRFLETFHLEDPGVGSLDDF
jgi:hypothetical protein